MEALDPNICPSCGNRESIQELGKKHTWQPIELCIEKAGGLGIRDYHSWEYGDECDVTGYHCRECSAEWDSLEHLLADMKLRHVLLALTEARTEYEEAEETGRVEQLRLWLEDALSRNQIVHPIDRERARGFIAADDWRSGEPERKLLAELEQVAALIAAPHEVPS